MIWLNVILMIIAVCLTVAILLQNRSAGLGGAFGGSSGEGFHVRRGGEKRIYQATIVLGALFVLVAAAHLFIG